MNERERIKELRAYATECGVGDVEDRLLGALDGWERALDERDEARDLVRRLVLCVIPFHDAEDVWTEAESRLRAWEQDK